MKYELDELTAENGSVLGCLELKPSERTLELDPDIADRLRETIDHVNAALRAGMSDYDADGNLIVVG